MTKIRQSQKLPPEQRREQLIASARKLFVRKGYRGTTTEEIARAAGVTKGALYYHFGSKEDILFAIVEAIYSHVGQELSRLEDRAPLSPADIVHWFFGLHTPEKRPDHRQMIDIWTQGMRIPRIARYIGEQYTGIIKRMATMIDPVYAPTIARRRHLAIFVAGLLDGLLVHAIYATKIVKLPRQIELVEKFSEALRKENTTSGGKA